jgi:hypothetical protein
VRKKRKQVDIFEHKSEDSGDEVALVSRQVGLKHKKQKQFASGGEVVLEKLLEM